MSQSIDKLPPHDIDAEMGVIGCCLMSRECIDASAEGGVDGSWFYDLRHTEAWNALLDVHSEGTAVDLITTANRLKAQGQLDHVGGLAYLSQLMDAVPSSANLPYYLPILREKWQLRRLLSAATTIVGSVFGKPEDAELAIAEAETAILGVRGEFGTLSDTTAKKVARRAVEALQERIAGVCDGLPIGWRYLDHITRGGFRPGEMIVMAGRPATGKTSLALSMARLLAGSGVPVGIVSLEMSDQELGGRFLAQESRLNWDDFDQNNPPTDDQYRRMTTAASVVGKLPIIVYEGASITVGGIAAKARRWVRNQGVRIVFVDYLQLIQGNPKLQRREQVDAISSGIKRLARELKIPVVVLAQLNREIEKDKDRKPRLSDLRESGAIEQDADFVGMLYRPKAPTEFDADDADMIEVNMFVAKNRRGSAQLDVPFMFQRSITEFTPTQRERPE
jgi:replicative DNA helicase